MGIMEKGKRTIYSLRSQLGLTVLLAVAVFNFWLAIKFFSSPVATTAALFNAGVDLMGSFVCAMLFYGCMKGGVDRNDQSSRWLRDLILFTSLSFLNNELLWYFTGNPDYGKYCLLFYSVAKWFDFTLTMFFYLYTREILEFRINKIVRWLDRGITTMLIPMLLLILANFFFPICFSVDELGNYSKEQYYWLVDLYLIIVGPLTTILLMQCNAPDKQKSVALSFILIPIAHYAITGGMQGYATQYGSVLVSITLIYCIIFGDRSEKLVATQNELRTATLIQDAMLPNIFPAFPDRPEFDLYATMDTAKEVGGDFYDFFLIDDDHLCMVIADVSGKGVPAALFMMISKVILQSCAMLGQSSAEILNKANEAICSNNETNMFVTVWVGIMEISTGTITAANAGHEYPILKRNGKFGMLKKSHGIVIGGIEGAKYKDYTIKLEPGDKLFLYTDGVPEAVNKELEMFGTERILKVLNKHKNATPTEILKIVREEVDRFTDGAEQFDDITMLCIEYKGTGGNQ